MITLYRNNNDYANKIDLTPIGELMEVLEEWLLLKIRDRDAIPEIECYGRIIYVLLVRIIYGHRD